MLQDKSIMFIVNPHAAGGNTGKNWDKMYGKITKLTKLNTEFIIADGIGTGITHTKDAIQSGYNVIVGVGGEGTMNEVVNGIYQKDIDNTVLGFIRSGTVNDYLGVIRWPNDLESQIKVIEQGNIQLTPLTKVNADITRVGLNVADAGVSANVAYMASVKRRITWIRGALRYNLLAIMAISSWKNIPVVIKADEREISGNLSLFMSGFSTQSGAFEILPHAEVFGEKMAYTIAMNLSKLRMISLMGTLRRGEHTEEINGVYMGLTKKIVINAEKSILFEVDGEPFSYDTSKIEIESLPKVLKVIKVN